MQKTGLIISHSTKIDPYLKIPCLHSFQSYSCLNMLEFSNSHTIPQSPSIGWQFKTILNSIKVFVLKICFDQCLQIAKIAMSLSYFCRHLVYLFNKCKGCPILLQKSFLFLSNEFQKQTYNWVIRFTLVIFINNVCVSEYAYAAVTIFKWDTENMLPNKREND